ncbi:MAG TPA: polyketide cyclase, partial [Saprospiraceae bacterium]|nr:polyketide cyclase [Saprospiraceae bacterium]
MKILKKIGLIILALIAIVLIAALFVSKELNYEKTITINKPIDYVWEYTNSLEDLDEWSPWMTYDPNMKKELTGVDGTVG